MLAKIKRRLSEKAVQTDDLIEAINREILPVLRAIRDAINNDVGEDSDVGGSNEARFALMTTAAFPTATSTVYSLVDNFNVFTAGYLHSDTDYPSEVSGRTRAAYFRVIGAVSGASTSVSFRLYDETIAAAVSGTEFTTTNTSWDDSGLLGPIALTDGHLYKAQAKRTDGTGEAAVILAEVVIRYE